MCVRLSAIEYGPFGSVSCIGISNETIPVGTYQWAEPSFGISNWNVPFGMCFVWVELCVGCVWKNGLDGYVLDWVVYCYVGFI